MKKWAHALNREISKEVIMANRYMKKCWTSLAIKEIQIKSTLRFHLTQDRMAILMNRNTNKSQWGFRETGALIHCWGECKLVQPFHIYSGVLFSNKEEWNYVVWM
jgi:hypothetical protein